MPLLPRATDGEIRAAIALVRAARGSDKDPLSLISVMRALHQYALGVPPEVDFERQVLEMNAWLDKYASLDYDRGKLEGKLEGKREGEIEGRLSTLVRFLALGGVAVELAATREWVEGRDLDALLLVAARDPASWPGPRSAG